MQTLIGLVIWYNNPGKSARVRVTNRAATA
jgi:hypothetical protein